MSSANQKTKTDKSSLPAATSNTSAEAPAMPDFMRQQAGRGLESLGAGDYEVPRLKLLQAISPEVIEGGFKPGQFYNTVLEEALDGPISCVPLYVSKAYILWRPRPPIDMGGMIARADDGVHWSPPSGEFDVKVDKRGTTVKWKMAPTVAASGLAEWGSFDPNDPKSPPAATQMINVAMWMREYPELSPVVMTFQRGSIRAGRKFIGKLKMSTAPIYGRIFNVSSFDDKNSNGDSYKNFRLEGAGFVQDGAEFRQYESAYEMFAKLGLKVRDMEGLQDDNSSPGAGSSEADDKSAF